MTPSSIPCPSQGLVLSDLHLFATRSDGSALFDSLQPQLTRIQVLVLNGDTFDFRWSQFPDHEATIQAALRWLNDLLGRLPQCDVHFVLGNHDCLSAFTQRLLSLAETHPRFRWHDKWLQLGDSLFLHGDCAQQQMDARGLERYRAGWREDQQRGTLASQIYTCADRLGLTSLAHRWRFPRRRTLERIAYYLDRAYPDWRRETRHCYFGHTHLPFSGTIHQRICFHNTGSAIRGMTFNPRAFELRDRGP